MGGPVSSLGEEVRKDSAADGGSGRLAGVMGGEGVKTAACKLQEIELRLQPAELTDSWCHVYTRIEVHRLQNTLHNVHCWP